MQHDVFAVDVSGTPSLPIGGGCGLVIEQLIERISRKEFSRFLRFSGGETPELPRALYGRNLLLYLHVPFCESLCPYCSFHRVVFEESLCRRYFDAMRKEMRIYGNLGYDFSGLYVGGGTPTVMMDELAATLALAKELFSIGEISVETNPNHLTDGNLLKLKGLGIQRLSVGVQSFDDTLLAAMGRFTKYGSGGDIFRRLVEIRDEFDTVNADMIFNLPLQSEESLARDLDRIIGSGIGQVTWYPLMVSDATWSDVEHAFGVARRTSEKKYYSLIAERLTAHFRFSSAWCFSRRESMVDEYIVSHDEYAGLGSGAIGYLGGVCYANTFSIEEYIERLGRGEIPLMASRTFSRRERARYDFVMKLFGMELDLDALRDRYGGEILSLLWKDIGAFTMAGGLHYEGGKLFLTDRGRYYWVIIMREFFTAVNNFRDYCRTMTKECECHG